MLLRLQTSGLTEKYGICILTQPVSRLVLTKQEVILRRETNTIVSTLFQRVGSAMPNQCTPTSCISSLPTVMLTVGAAIIPLVRQMAERTSRKIISANLALAHIRAYTGIVFEPNDEYKGDFARIYFYMATCYEDKIAGWKSDMLGGNKYPAYKNWVVSMLLKWAKEDPVSQKEIDRNNAVYECQKNRNPYVDYPGLEQYVWGDKQSVAFSYDNYDGTNPNPEPTPDPGPDPDPGTNPDPGTDPTPTDGYVFSKVTSTADVVPGSYYLIVCEGEKQALAEKNNDVRGNAAVTISNATITTTVDVSGKPRQLLLGGTADAYTFYDNVDKDYLYLALTANDNKLQSSTSATNANAQWTVTVSSDGVATIKNCKFTDREVRYNKSSPRFACYKGAQQTVSLYRRVQSTGIMPVKPSAVDSRVDVFTVSGVLVRRQVVRSAALNGLAKGVYIIGGKKYAVE